MPSSHPLLSSLYKASESYTVRRYSKGETIFCEGDNDQKVYVLIQGLVVAYRTTPNGQQRILQFFVPEDIYGNIILADGIVHTMTTEAASDVVNVEILKQELRALSSQNPDLLWYLYEDLARKLRHVSNMIEASCLTAEQRIARAIAELCLQFGYRTDSTLELRIDMTQEDLARYAGTTRVTVAKTLSRLVANGILQTRPKPWRILDINALLDQTGTMRRSSSR